MTHIAKLPDARPDRHPADLVESGNLLRTQAGALPRTPDPSQPGPPPRRHDVVVIGAGQAGLSVSYYLKRKGIDHAVLEAAPRIGEVWRNRWDSLRLFTPAKFDGLPGCRFPAPGDAFPTKDQMADFLESYARRFGLPVRLNTRAECLHGVPGRFRIETGDRPYEAAQVVIAAASYRAPRLPDFAGDLGPDIFEMHARDYRSPRQLPQGPVLLVGAGNSGAEIAMELSRTHEVTLSGRPVGNVPFDIGSFLGRKLLVRLVVRGMFHHVLTMRTPVGRRFRDRMHGRGLPLIRTRPGQLKAAGVRRIGRIAGVREGRPLCEDGVTVACASVIWCTGYHPGFDWIDLPVLDSRGWPRHRFGRVTDLEGVYFAGLPFQYAVSSAMISGAGRDARRIAGWIEAAARRRL